MGPHCNGFPLLCMLRYFHDKKLDEGRKPCFSAAGSGSCGPGVLGSVHLWWA